MSENDLYIDQSKCRQCGICTTVCPVKVFKKRKETVCISNDKLKFCINCNDCISVCPSEAIIKHGLDLKKLSANDISYYTENFLAYLENRRTIRKYKNINLTEEEITYLEGIASLAPKGGHTENVRNTGIIVVKDKDVIKKIEDYSYNYTNILRIKLTSLVLKIGGLLNKSLKENINSTVERIDSILEAKEKDINMLTYDASNLIVLHCEKGNPVSRENATIMEYQIMLGAESIGLGTCFLGWVSFALQSYQVKKAKELKMIYNILEIPVNREIVAVFSIGHKLCKYHRLKNREKFKIAVK